MPGCPHPWLVLAAATLPAALEYALMSIAGVGTRYIVGGLGGDPANGFWVGTAYQAAAAVMMAASAWFADRLGRRRYMLVSVAGFTAATALCGLATDLNTLIAWRVVQGVFAGGLQPCGMAVLLDYFPRDRQAVPLSVYGAATFGGLLLAPAPGGWLVDAFSWRWTFLAPVPLLLLAVAGVALFIHDPPALTARRAALLSRPVRFDWVGLGLIAAGITGLQVFVGKGQEWDWFRDPFHRVHLAFAAAVLGLALGVRRMIRAAEPLVDLRPLGDRQFAVCGAVLFGGLALLYSTTGAMTELTLALFGYDATLAGEVTAPGSAVGVGVALLALWLLRRGASARRMVVLGFLVVAGGCFWVSVQTLALDFDQIMLPRVVQVVGLVLALVPLLGVACRDLPADWQAAAAGLIACLRFIGGTIGGALGTVLLERRDQFHITRTNFDLDVLNPFLTSTHGTLRDTFFRLTGDPAAADAMGWAEIAAMRDRQALSLACFDVYWVAAWVAVGMAGLALLMRRPPVRG
ncbi:MAG: DHA2 family efflux MFS transporter permease subunit [Gemmataceae bacterium]|nr:DHA2 family efflux MFS transporter permease subunit [Gemmataceae bacterium]